MCNYCGSTHKKYGSCIKCGNEICEDCASLVTSKIYKVKGERPRVHKAGHCWGYRYGPLLKKIQEKAKALCRQVKDTEYKEIGEYVIILGRN